MTRTSAAPESPPEQKRLRYFVGTWKFQLQMKPSSFGPGGIVTGTDQDEMLSGDFFLVRRYETQSPLGDFRGLEVLGYDPVERAYFQRGFDNRGQTHLYRGSVEGDTWTWAYEIDSGRQRVKARIRIREVSPTRQDYSSAVSPDGETWTTVLEGTLEKVK